MSDQQQEPDPTGPGGVHRLAGYLDWLREDVIVRVLGLSASEQRTSRLPSGWTPLEMLSHLLHMEQRWFIWGFLGEDVAEPWGDWSRQDGPEARWTVADGETAVALASRLRAVGERTRAILMENALEGPAATGGRFTESPPTLDWICFHVLAEYARHAGHVDIVAELARG